MGGGGHCVSDSLPGCSIMRVRSDHRKYDLGQVLQLRLKIEENCRLFLDIFSSVKMTDFYLFFNIQTQDGCQMW